MSRTSASKSRAAAEESSIAAEVEQASAQLAARVRQDRLTERQMLAVSSLLSEAGLLETS